MGAWGYFSDENDGTYDILPVGFAARIGGSDPVPAAERAARSRDFNRLLTKLAARYKKDRSTATHRFVLSRSAGGTVPKNLRGLPNTVFAGAVMWGLKQGLHLNKNHIQTAKQQLQFELEQLQAGIDVLGWNDPKQRIRALRQEMADLDKSLRTGFGIQRRIRSIGGRTGRGRQPRKQLRHRKTKRRARKSKKR